jgi:hypothetical protein
MGGLRLNSSRLYLAVFAAGSTEIKSPIPLFEKWGFHDLAILAPPKIERRRRK